jgi:hypothetical protein
MSNRYSKTGLTKRQVSTIKSLRDHIARIYEQRKNKNDSEVSLAHLIRAWEHLGQAMTASREWKANEK